MQTEEERSREPPEEAPVPASGGITAQQAQHNMPAAAHEASGHPENAPAEPHRVRAGLTFCAGCFHAHGCMKAQEVSVLSMLSCVQEERQVTLEQQVQPSMQHHQQPNQHQQQLPLHPAHMQQLPLQPGGSGHLQHGLSGSLPFGLSAAPSDPFMHILGLPPPPQHQQHPQQPQPLPATVGLGLNICLTAKRIARACMHT